MDEILLDCKAIETLPDKFKCAHDTLHPACASGCMRHAPGGSIRTRSDRRNLCPLPHTRNVYVQFWYKRTQFVVHAIFFPTHLYNNLVQIDAAFRTNLYEKCRVHENLWRFDQNCTFIFRVSVLLYCF